MSNNNVVTEKLSELKTRARKRNISVASNQKSENDITPEKDFFETMKNQIYTQIARKEEKFII